MIKHEQKLQSEFNRWLKYNFHRNAVFELKVIVGKHFYPRVVVEHQRDNLLAATNHFIYKIPDDSRSQKPFDSIKMLNPEAYVVLQFKRRGNKTFYMIDVNTFLNIKEKSLTEEDVRDISTYQETLK